MGPEMKQDPKERAEHLMLVDLGRNDVGRVAETGSVRVSEFEIVERHNHIGAQCFFKINNLLRSKYMF